MPRVVTVCSKKELQRRAALGNPPPGALHAPAHGRDGVHLPRLLPPRGWEGREVPLGSFKEHHQGPCTKTSVVGPHTFPQSRIQRGTAAGTSPKLFPSCFQMQSASQESQAESDMSDVVFGWPSPPVTLKAFGKAHFSLSDNCNNLSNAHNDSELL